MGVGFERSAALREEIELRLALVMHQLGQITITEPIEAGLHTADGPTFFSITSSRSRPPSPPDSGTTTPRLTIGPCPARLTPYYPPPNYGCVDHLKIYRSSFPQDRHISFVQSLKIKSVLTLVDTEPTLGFQYWLDTGNIKWARLNIAPNKDKSGRVDTNLASICEALLYIMDSSNYPVYVHCNQGKHRTGCVVACLRKVQGWHIDEILKEYNAYAGEKSRPGDRALIKSFDPNCVFEHARSKGFLDGFSMPIVSQNRAIRADSIITDIVSLLAALEAGLYREASIDGDLSTSSRSPTPPGTRTPIVMTNGEAKAEYTKVMDFAEGTNTVCLELDNSSRDSVPDGRNEE